MTQSFFETLLEEYDLELDDLRWYISVELTEELLALQSEPKTLINRIWSGRLGDELYNMEERYIDDQNHLFTSGQTDEVRLRELCQLIKGAKRRRGKLSQ
jgi:predicted  nucleic acid-binding Zn-ribbon protein